MYIPAHFAEPDAAHARAIIEANPFGLLVVPRVEGTPEMAHLPFVVDSSASPLGTLRAHVARANPVAALLAAAPSVVAVFTGPHGYVTPRWYASPRTSVPTWNFVAVHAHGVARRVDDRDELRRSVAELASKHEADAAQRWSLDGADPRHIEALLGGIVGFAIRIDRFETKLKLSQNRPAADRAGVIAGLRERGGPGDEALAAMIEARGSGETHR